MIDLDVCKENNGIYDLASASIIEDYPDFYYSLINNYFDNKISDDFWIVYNLYSILYILDYIFYTYRMESMSVEKGKNKLESFNYNNQNFKIEEPLWYSLKRRGE